MGETAPEVEAAAVWVEASALTPDPRNPRDNEAAVAKVADSIKRFGFASPIVARKADGMVIAGHTRLAAARSLGLDRVPVRYLDLDPADARLLNLADNRLGEIATWRTDDLGALLKELRDEGLDLDVVGFDDAELDALLGDLGGDGNGAGGAGGLPSPPIAGAEERYPATLINGDCIETLRAMPPDSVDAVLTDPPYGLGFMGKGWDAPDMAWASAWAAELLRVCKPGAHVVAFGATTTLHRIVVALEDAGFEVRDTLSWVTWQGFPKNVAADLAIDRHLGKVGDRAVVGEAANWGAQSPTTYGEFKGKDGKREWDITAPATPEARAWYGHGTALRPAVEPAVLVRKPLDGTLAENLLRWGTGALHIDACRHPPGDGLYLGPNEDTPTMHSQTAGARSNNRFNWGSDEARSTYQDPRQALGRYPTNMVRVPKVSRTEREWGTDGLEPRRPAGKEGRADGSAGTRNPRAGAGRGREGDRNYHPTVKPIALGRWLVRLIAPRPGSVIVDTFAGSGGFAVAGIVEGHRVTAIEREGPEGLGYFAILEARCAAAVEGGAEATAAVEAATLEGEEDDDASPTGPA